MPNRLRTYVAPVWFAWSWIACAQQPMTGVTAAPDGPGQYTLHVYENLVQVPALILNGAARPIVSLEKSQVFISVDSGTFFHPPHMHVEGDEPLALAILIDAGDDQPWPNGTLKRQIAKLATVAHLQGDRVNIYAVDCKVVGALAGNGGSDPTTPATVKLAIDANLASPALHDGKGHAACGKSLALWDAASSAVRQLGQQDGRKVLLMLSNGQDHGSTNTWNQLRAYAAEQGVAIFGIREGDNIEMADGTPVRVDDPVLYIGQKNIDSPYQQLCLGTGGLVLQTPDDQLAHALRKVLAMVRGRYILEFPWPEGVADGYHTLSVRLSSPLAFVATSGVTIKMPDAAKLNGPATLPAAPSPVVLGQRRPLTPN